MSSISAFGEGILVRNVVFGLRHDVNRTDLRVRYRSSEAQSCESTSGHKCDIFGSRLGKVARGATEPIPSGESAACERSRYGDVRCLFVKSRISVQCGTQQRRPAVCLQLPGCVTMLTPVLTSAQGFTRNQGCALAAKASADGPSNSWGRARSRRKTLPFPPATRSLLRRFLHDLSVTNQPLGGGKSALPLFQLARRPGLVPRH
jgi:hypothetical protein